MHNIKSLNITAPDCINKNYLPELGILPQYTHLCGIAENMPIIRKLLGLSEYGTIPNNTAVGRAVQRFVEIDCKNVLS